MIAPLSNCLLKPIQYEAVTLKARLTALFFKIIGVLSSRWEPYANYYEAMYHSRRFAKNLAPDRFIEHSANWVHPKKIKPVPPIEIKSKNLYLIQPNKKPQGFCLGMCLDYMRRFNSSYQPFNETLADLCKKFAQGSTKKAYFLQMRYRQIRFRKDYLKKMDDEINSSHANEVVGRIRAEVFNELGFKFDLTYPLLPFSKGMLPTKKHFDSLILYGFKPKTSAHAVCLMKRDQGFVIFDPNYGTYLFEKEDEALEFIDKSAKALFSNPIAYEVYQRA